MRNPGSNLAVSIPLAANSPCVHLTESLSDEKGSAIHEKANELVPNETHNTKGEALALIVHRLEGLYNKHDVLYHGDKCDMKFCAYNLLRKKDKPAYAKLFGKPDGTEEDEQEEEEEVDERASKPFGWGAQIGVKQVRLPAVPPARTPAFASANSPPSPLARADSPSPTSFLADWRQR